MRRGSVVSGVVGSIHHFGVFVHLDGEPDPDDPIGFVRVPEITWSHFDEVEEVLAAHKDVAECAVVGIADALKGEVPCGFIVLKAGVDRAPAEIEQECVALVRERIGPVAAFKLAITVGRLPKTRSGKILRGTMKKIAEGTEYTLPATIDDPAILDEIAATLRGLGYPRRP